jgi:hypothetical protein
MYICHNCFQLKEYFAEVNEKFQPLKKVEEGNNKSSYLCI